MNNTPEYDPTSGGNPDVPLVQPWAELESSTRGMPVADGTALSMGSSVERLQEAGQDSTPTGNERGCLAMELEIPAPMRSERLGVLGDPAEHGLQPF
ncbi:MAG: hypothetical protein ACOCXA_01675 [Planctomycetota bacterium]